MFTNDTVHNGVPVPGLAGRVFLFGPDMSKTLRCQGVLTVDLYDTQQVGQDGNPKLLQRWNIDKVSLDQLIRPHIIGWGYTLFLPGLNMTARSSASLCRSASIRIKAARFSANARR